ncbi:MAG: ferritin-like domain-containing protein [Bryobacteraceae bacterium]|jgi:ferritin-like metal-binding protein YciE
MKFESLHELYLSELKDLYSAEDQIFKALPKVIEKAASAELRRALEHHLEETRGHVSRLEEVFEMHGEEPKKQKCKGMQGILEEGEEMLGKDAEPEVRDAAIISACQRVEHYEIAAYGTVRTYAQQMGQERAAAVLKQTLDEEMAADKKLTQIANSQVNIEARTVSSRRAAS